VKYDRRFFYQGISYLDGIVDFRKASLGRNWKHISQIVFVLVGNLAIEDKFLRLEMLPVIGIQENQGTSFSIMK